jgi:hypothetical protein
MSMEQISHWLSCKEKFTWLPFMGRDLEQLPKLQPAGLLVEQPSKQFAPPLHVYWLRKTGAEAFPVL